MSRRGCGSTASITVNPHAYANLGFKPEDLVPVSGFLAGPTVLGQVRAGKRVALAVSGARRSALLPDVPRP